jgi:hypothetical protein
LPATGGAWIGFPATLLKKDANFVRTHADYLDARATQARSAQACVDARIELARSIARLDWLPEILEADYVRGKLDRAYSIELQRIAHQTSEAQARAGLAAARQLLASYEPQPAETPIPSGLSTDEVEDIIASLPEASDELRRTISLLLKGRLKEKQG